MSKQTILPTETRSLEAKRRAVRRLPAPQKGVVLNIPLDLWPLYMQLHKIKPNGYRIPTATLLIKRKDEPNAKDAVE